MCLTFVKIFFIQYICFIEHKSYNNVYPMLNSIDKYETVLTFFNPPQKECQIL